MDLKQLTLLLPCHSLEDFPTHHQGEEALDLLLAWSTLWHPTLLQKTGKMPQWRRCEDPPEDCDGHAILIPIVSQNRVPSGFTVRCEDQNGFAHNSTTDRQADTRAILEQFNLDSKSVSNEAVKDFHALAYTYLQIQLLTRQLRYSSNLDEVHFETQLLKAAEAACQADSETCKQALDRCFDVLAEERHRYYPTDSYLVDLTLLAPTTLGKKLQQQLQSDRAHNYLVTAELLAQLKTHSPETFQLLKERHRTKQAEFVGCSSDNLPTGLLSYQTLVNEVTRGQAFFEQEFDSPLKVFACRSGGLEQTLPSVLSYAGFHAAIHESFDDSKLPSPNSTNFRWQGPDGQFINSLTKTILDSSDPNVFLKLGIQIGESLDIDHLAIMQMVHWPHQASPIYDDLIRSAKRCNALGKWSTYGEVFAEVHEPGYNEAIDSSDYRSNYLAALLKAHNSTGENGTSKNATGEEVSGNNSSTDPISSARQFIEAQQFQSTINGLAALTQLANGARSVTSVAEYSRSTSKQSNDSNSDSFKPSGSFPDLDIATTRKAEQSLRNQLVESLTETSTASESCRLILNPTGQPIRLLLSAKDLKGFSLEDVPPDQIYHVSQGLTETSAILDIPAMGYVHLKAGRNKIPAAVGEKLKNKKHRGKILVNQTTLRNEYLEATVDPDTGSIRSIHNYEKRGNLCSLQVAWYDAELKKQIQAALKKETSDDWRENLAQLWKGKSDARERELAAHQGGYSRMQVESIQTIANNSATASIKTIGHLCIRKKQIAKFEIQYRLNRGSRFVEVHASIQPLSQKQTIKLGKQRTYDYPSSAKNSSGYRNYFAWRLAHCQPGAESYRDLNSLRLPATGNRFTATQMVEWLGEHRISWHCQANAFHKAPADGKLDTLIGLDHQHNYESQASIGFGPSHSLALAQTSSYKPDIIPCGPLKAGLPAAAWLFNCSSRHVAAIHWQLDYQEDQFRGMRIRLLETGCKERKLKLDFAVPPVQVTLKASDPNYQPKCEIEGSQIHCDIGPHEMIELTVRFK